MRGKLLLLLAVAAFTPPARAADPPYKKVTVPVSPRPRPALKDDVQPAADIPLDLSKAVPSKSLGNLPSSAAQLGTLKAEIAHEKPAVDSAKQKSDQLSAEAASLRQKLIATAARIESLEQETITLGEEIERLEKQDAELTAGFERDRISVTKLLAILERLQHDMPPALAVRPDDALAAARGAMLVGASLPPVYAEAARLARRIDALKATRIALVKRRAEAHHHRSPAHHRAGRSGDSHHPERGGSRGGRRRVRHAQSQAGRHCRQGGRFPGAGEPGGGAQALAPAVSGDITIVTASNSGSLGPLTKGSLLPPVVGTIASGNADTAESIKNPGITYMTRDAAQVIAPSDGRVLFAGPYHKSGQVLILEITTGYDLVLAGLGRVTVRPNDEVLAGEPLGSMPAQSGSPDERLYFELRQNGHGVDPRPWLSLELRKAKGT